MWLGIWLLVAISTGFLVVFLHRSTKSKGFGVKLLLGCAAGFGIFILLNAVVEVVGYLQPAQREQEHVVDERPFEPPSDPQESSPATTTQEVRWPNGKLKARREVIKDRTGEFIAHGKATTWYENGQLKWQGEYRNGRQVGKWTEWYENGRKEGEGELKEDGTSFEVHWHPNGQKKSEGPGKYVAEQNRYGKHGKWLIWNENGQKLGEMHFRDNQLHGTMTLWHENGKMKLEAEYTDGKMHGRARTWDEDGNLVAEEYYSQGVLTKTSGSP
ncbi:MAG: hypothetical protein KatS3mg105_3023 [Gemmatales bacterium]|nr:MAG: hypothetical protein KatS3mg105_3023 [Gemmatales bacterium]